MDELEGEEIEYEIQRRVDRGPRKRVQVKVEVPKREPSLVIPPRKIEYITPDKTTCVTCPCYTEEPYIYPKKLTPCLNSPLTLYELAGKIVDEMEFPQAFDWSEEDVADWMENVVGLPQYRTCILDNHINGRRLLMLEDPSRLPDLNIRYYEHIKLITAKVREIFVMEFIRFSRSIGLPPRLPLTHCTWFKSRTGPSWGIRQNWSRSDILRWMKIINAEPFFLNHWELVWYVKPDFPRTLLTATKPGASMRLGEIPHYVREYGPPPESCREYLVPRKFRIQRGIPLEQQYIWMERRPESPKFSEVSLAAERKWLIEHPYKPTVPKATRLYPPTKIKLKGLTGEKLILARRLMPRKKFAINVYT